MKLNVTHDTTTYEVITNGSECDYCDKKEHPYHIISGDFDQAICEDCWENIFE